MKTLLRSLRSQAYRVRTPEWLLFRLKHAAAVRRMAPPAEPTAAELLQKEAAVRGVLDQQETRRFLEIGIGSAPILERVRRMADSGIEYVACDFAHVCDKHARLIHEAGIDTARTRFIKNTTGTYAWPLFELASSGERFDAIYLDGHHTFYIDLPAFLAADWLLKPGGYLILDDVAWTLDLIRKLMFESYGHWYFYHPIYSFKEYTEAQQSEPHIGKIAQHWLLEHRGYERVEAWSSPYWWTTRKPA